MLHTFPPEVLHIIFRYLIDSEPPETKLRRNRKNRLLWSLSLTNRYFNSVINPILYEKLELRDIESCRLLLRTLQEKSDLGLFCTSLALHDSVRWLAPGQQEPTPKPVQSVDQPLHPPLHWPSISSQNPDRQPLSPHTQPSVPPSHGLWPPPPSDTTGTFALSLLPGWTPPDIATTSMHELSAAWTNMQKDLAALEARNKERLALASAQTAKEDTTLGEQAEQPEQPTVNRAELQPPAKLAQGKEKKNVQIKETIKAVFGKFGYDWKSTAGETVGTDETSTPAKFVGGLPWVTLHDPWVWAWLVLYYLPNLRSLSLSFNPGKSLQISESFLYQWFRTAGSVGSSPYCLGKLSSITYTKVYGRVFRTDPSGANYRKFVHLLLDMPNVREVSLCDVGCFFLPNLEEEFLEGSNSSAPSPLEVLSLQHCRIEGVCLSNIFRRTHRLRIINFSLYGNDCGNEGDNAVDHYSSAFSLLKDCLEDLTLIPSRSLGEPFGWIGDLKDFRKLRRLTIDWQFFTLPEFLSGSHSSDFLPDKLERLEIQTYVDEEWVEYNPEYYRIPYVQEGYRKKLHAEKVPTFRLAPYHEDMDSEGAFNMTWYPRAIPEGNGDSGEWPGDYMN